jgi:hypothetical protein
MVINYDGKHVGRAAVGAQQYHVIEFTVFNRNGALYLVMDNGFAFRGRFKPDHIGRIGGRRSTITPRAAEFRIRIGFAEFFELGLCRITFEGFAVLYHLVGDIGMAR